MVDVDNTMLRSRKSGIGSLDCKIPVARKLLIDQLSASPHEKVVPNIYQAVLSSYAPGKSLPYRDCLLLKWQRQCYTKGASAFINAYVKM